MFWLLKDGCQLRSSSIISLDQYIIFQPTQFWIPESRWCDLAGICQGTSFSISQYPSIVIKYLENFILKAKMSKTKGMSCEFFLFIAACLLIFISLQNTNPLCVPDGTAWHFGLVRPLLGLLCITQLSNLVYSVLAFVTTIL